MCHARDVGVCGSGLLTWRSPEVSTPELVVMTNPHALSSSFWSRSTRSPICLGSSRHVPWKSWSFVTERSPSCTVRCALAANCSSGVPCVAMNCHRERSSRANSFLASCERRQVSLEMGNGRKTINPARLVHRDTMTYGGSVPLQLARSTITRGSVRPCAL